MKNVQKQYFTSEKRSAIIQITKRSQAGFPKALQDDPSGMKEAFVMLKIFEEIEEFMEAYYESFSEGIH